MPPVLRLILALGGAAVIGALDATAGPRLVFAPFYLIVIGLAAWHMARVSAMVAAIGCGGARAMSELAWHGPDGAAIWNAAAWTAIFVALAWFVGRARARREEVTALDGRVTELVQIEHRFARTDPLTQLSNRRAFVDALQQAQARTRRSGGALAVARLDIDGFGRLNEIYSRAHGDQFLRAISTSLSLTTRMGDVAARLEDDEFGILLYGCGPNDARRVGQRLVAEIADLGRAYPEARVTGSIGVACFTTSSPDPDEMLRLSGVALRQMQHQGGNGVRVEREWPAGQTNRADPEPSG
jgi:diguanylate cyclase (GGDEF)-like protein